SDDREIPDLDWGGNGSLRSTDRQCDTEREAAGGAAQERNEGGWREDIAQCYSGNRGIGKCSAISCSIGECSAISCGDRPADDGRHCGGQGGSAEGATGQAAGATNQTAAREFQSSAETGQSSGGHVQRELSDSRKRSLARAAIRSISIVSSGTA